MRTSFGPVTLLLLLCLAEAPAALTLHVPEDYPTLASALAAAASGDVIEVACGTYHEYGLVMKSGVTLRSESGDPACVTVDGDSLGRIFLCSGVSAITRIEGITIRGGRTAGYANELRGAGMLCDGGAALTISHCVFEENACDYGYGGGLACVFASPVVEDCVFRRNVAHGPGSEDGLGGAVSCQSSSARFERCLFEDNAAANHGGAMFLNESPLDMIDCVFLSNEAVGGHGGAIRCRSGSPRIIGCRFESNVADGGGNGGAMMISPNASPIIEASEFRNNQAPGSSGGALYIRDSCSPQLSECVFEGNEASDGGAVHIRDNSNAEFETCVFITNKANLGGAVDCWTSDPVFASCTFVRNDTESGGGFLVSRGEASPLFDRCIIAFQTGSVVVGCMGTYERFPELRCCDLFGNAGGDWEVTCVADQAGVNGNFSADPLFCDLQAGVLTLDGASPCLPGQHPEGDDCGLIGTFERGCGATNTSNTTWGAIKTQFR